MNYLLDTNILLHFLKRRSSPIVQILEDELNIFGDEHNAIISVVTVGEIKSFGRKNKWGATKLKSLEGMLSQLLVLPISDDVIEAYVEIDTYSQGMHESLNLNTSARNMGKNDIWIAATASVINARLITTDKDFSHLANDFLDLLLLSIKGKYLNPDDYVAKQDN